MMVVVVWQSGSLLIVEVIDGRVQSRFVCCLAAIVCVAA
jgi:hypothetical protein